MKSGILESMKLLGMIDTDFMSGNLGKRKSQKFRCKVCGNWETQQSDKKNICVDCREEYLSGNG